MCPQTASRTDDLPLPGGLTPYVIAISEAGEDRPLALCETSSVAYAAYYAALREYFGRRLTLRRGDRVLATSQSVSPLS